VSRRSSRAALAVLVALVVGCADHPPPPDWQTNAKSSLDRAVSAWLGGNSRAEAQEFAAVRAEVASTAQPALVARVELVRCAAHVASLDLDPCRGYEAVAVDAPPAERAYAAYLAGAATPAEATLLPPQHRAVAAATTPAAGVAALAGIDDPLARLVAAAVLLRGGRASPESVARAVDTASAQGWRRPLLAWLKVQLRGAEASGDGDAAERIRRRIQLVEEGMAPTAAAPASAA
jgi:hypothetical protein